MLKRGLSQTVSIVIFIILVLASVSMLYSSLVPLFNSPGESLDNAFSCIELQQSQSVKINEVTKDSNKVYLNVNVNPLYFDSINELSFVLKNDEGSKILRCGLVCGGECNIAPGEKTYVVDDEGYSGVDVLANDNCAMDSRVF